MSRFHSYLNSAKVVIHQYDGSQPLAVYLKNLFSGHKKYGSKDRKQISHLCYCYCRTGKAFHDFSIEEKILVGLFLCSNESQIVLQHLKPEWNEVVEKTLKEKLHYLGIENVLPEVFPFMNELSEDIDKEQFVQSFFVQPDLFIRIRPGKEKAVLQNLKKAEINSVNVADDCLSFPNNTKLDEVISLDEEAVVQDLNSQKLGAFFKMALLQNDKPTVWDCCAASGGKSILLHDINAKVDLTVSDIRESILANLEKRFKKAGIKNYQRFVVDLEKSVPENEKKSFDLIIADVPCTGSGTWSRTPEQLAFFEAGKIDQYTSKQKNIVSNAIAKLNKGGNFIYITCSVFKKENENIVEYIQQEHKLNLMKMEVLKGYNQKADSMFVAVFNS
jgi:16S rRNA (cytosine967-C5)-methyltransferase